MDQSITEITRLALTELSTALKIQPSGVIGIQGDEGGGWAVTAEMLEKKSIPDAMDILGVYEIHLDAMGKIRDFSRTHLRKRGDTG
jgi:hypothetical protein